MPTPLRALAILLAAVMAAAAAAGARDLSRPRRPSPPPAGEALRPAAALPLPEWPGAAAQEVARVGARVTALLEDGDGARWIGTGELGLFRAEPGGGALAVAGLDGAERRVNALAEQDGLVWAATGGGLVAFDGDRRVLTLLAGEDVPALVRAPGALVAATARGLFRVATGAGADRLDVAGPAGEPLRPTALAAGPTRLWIGTASGIYSLPLALLDPALLSRTARSHPLGEGDPAEAGVTALAPLGDGAVAGTGGGGVVWLRDDGGAVASRFEDPLADAVSPGAADACGDAALLGTAAGALVVRGAGAALAVARAGPLGRAGISALRVRGDRVLVGTTGGAVLDVGGDACRVVPPPVLRSAAAS
jgi:hypothetical protein